MSNVKTESQSFDVFMCHNSEDKAEVRRIADGLIKDGINPWLDEREIRPGELWQTALEEQVSTIKSATVFVGESGLGPWQNMEMRAFINEFVERKCPVIPAILSSAKTTPSLPILLKSLHYVDFRVAEPDPLAQLKWGITGEKPKGQTFVGVESKDDFALLPEKTKQTIEIRLPGNLDTFASKDKEKLLDAINTLLQIDGEIKITAMRAGSVRLFLDLTPEDADKIYAAVNSGQFNNLGITEARWYPSLADPPSDKQHSELLILLNRVKVFWIDGVFKQSLHHEVLISLGKRAMDEAVEPLWNRTINLPRQRRQLSFSNSRIETVFDATGLLLILGEPGSGKTTTLLELLKTLIQRAKTDPKERIPVVLNLSSWNKNVALIVWMTDRLSTIYSVPKKLALSWLERDYLIPLLDGLDEVQTGRQADCVEAINAYITQTEPAGLVVCCRLMEYQWLPEHLKLNGAICIEPLNSEQIDRYFAAVGSGFDSLRMAIKEDTVLQELTQSPLILNIMSLAYQSAPMDEFADKELPLEARRKRIFAAYVDAMFKRKASMAQVFPKEKAIDWLAWLARTMTQQSQSVLLVENLQPVCLNNRKQQLTYRTVTSLIVGLIFGAIVGSGWGAALGLLAWLIVAFAIGFRPGSTSSIKIGIYCLSISGLIGLLFDWLQLWIIAGLFYGLVIGLILWLVLLGVGELNCIKTVESLRWSWTSFFEKTFWCLLLGGFFFGLISWLYNGMISVPYGGAQDFNLEHSAVFAGLICGLIGGILGGFTDKIREDKSLPNQGITLSGKYGVFIVLMFLLASGTIDLIQEVSIMTFGLITGVIAGLHRGLGAAIKHYVLRLVLWYSGRIPLKLIPFLDYCASLILLKKVGGSYIFIHRMLLEYFAKLAIPNHKRTKSSGPKRPLAD